MSDLKLTAIPTPLVEVVWPMALPHIMRVVEKAPDEVEISVIKQALIDGNEWMVTVSDGEDIIAVNIIKVSVFDTGIRTLYIPIIGGDRLDEWMEPFMNILHRAAIDLNCTELRGIACRKGWLRKLKDYDWYRIHEIVGCKVKQTKEV